jgi:hypothetical protein
MMFVTTLFNYVRDDWDAKVVMEWLNESSESVQFRVAIATICRTLTRCMNGSYATCYERK